MTLNQYSSPQLKQSPTLIVTLSLMPPNSPGGILGSSSMMKQEKRIEITSNCSYVTKQNSFESIIGELIDNGFSLWHQETIPGYDVIGGHKVPESKYIFKK